MFTRREDHLVLTTHNLSTPFMAPAKITIQSVYWRYKTYPPENNGQLPFRRLIVVLWCLRWSDDPN